VQCKEGRPVLETSVGFRSWSRSSVASPQVTKAINRAVGCRYFPPGPWLPTQPSTITTCCLVPNYTAWWQKQLLKQLSQSCKPLLSNQPISRDYYRLGWVPIDFLTESLCWYGRLLVMRDFYRPFLSPNRQCRWTVALLQFTVWCVIWCFMVTF